MTFSQLRQKHPRLIYQDFEVKPAGKNLRITFNFLLEPDIVFTPEISIPIVNQESPGRGQETPGIKNLAFHLGLVEAISYWKAACPAELVVRAGYLSPDQIAWWRGLFIHGLGEFFFRNQIDFTYPNFLTISNQFQNSSESGGASGDPIERPQPVKRVGEDVGWGAAKRQDPNRETSFETGSSGDLILVGGGKDSIVTMEMLKTIPGRQNVLFLDSDRESPGRARRLLTTALAGFSNPIIVERAIDPRLLQLNKLGYLNGHTPFSAYLAFLGVFVAKLHGYKNVISSNELSAGEASLIYKSMEINHQYSKSFEFEKLFRAYCSRYLTPDINYFSFLRPLYELQIAGIFSSLRATGRSVAISSGLPRRFAPRNDVSDGKYDSVFVSCNVGRGKFWCGRCPKCAFSYLSLFPFMSDARLKKIFGRDLFGVPEIQKHILDLVGLGKYKPFDCVGTQDESILAVALAIKKNRKQKEFLLSLEKRLKLHNQTTVRKLEKKIMDNWGDQNFLPDEYSMVLNRSLLAKPGNS